MAQMASIDIAAMGKLVTAATTAQSNIPYLQWGLQSALNPVDVDASPASRLAAVAAWCGEAVPGLQRRLTLAQSIESKTPGLAGVVSIDESTIATTTPAQAVAQAQADAKALTDAHGIPSQAVLDSIAKNSNDPYYAQAFANSTTPTDLSNALLDASSKYRSAGASGVPMTADQIKAWQAQYGQLLGGVSATIATATRGSGPFALPDGYAKSWSDAVTDDRAIPGQASALALILKSGGTFGTPFLDSLSGTVYDYERNNSSNGPLWHPRAYPGDGTFAGPFAADGSNASSDPLAGILSALGNNAQAAQDFFNGGGTTNVDIQGHHVDVSARMQYLIQSRTWSPDVGSDNGTGLGAALQEATTAFRDQSSQGQLSAALTGEMFGLIGSQTGQGQGDHSILGKFGAQGWKMWGGMRTNVANIVASYSPDLVRIVGGTPPHDDQWTGSWYYTPPANENVPANGPPSALLNVAMMQAVLGTLGEDPHDIDIVNAGVAAYGKLLLDHSLQQQLVHDPNAKSHILQGNLNEPFISGASGSLATTLGFVEDNAYHGDLANSDYQKKRAEDISKVLGIITSVPSLELPEGHAWTGFLIDQIKDQALDKIGEGPDGDPKADYNSSATGLRGEIERMMLNAMLRNGYFSPDAFAQANQDSGTSNFQPPPPGAIQYQDGKPVGFNYDSDAYRTWTSQGQNLPGFIETYGLTKFQDQFGPLGE